MDISKLNGRRARKVRFEKWPPSPVKHWPSESSARKAGCFIAKQFRMRVCRRTRIDGWHRHRIYGEDFATGLRGQPQAIILKVIVIRVTPMRTARQGFKVIDSIEIGARSPADRFKNVLLSNTPSGCAAICSLRCVPVNNKLQNERDTMKKTSVIKNKTLNVGERPWLLAGCSFALTPRPPTPVGS